MGALALAASTLLASRGMEPFRTWYFQAAWFPTIALLDGGLALRTGRSPLLGRPRFAVSLFFWSAPTWYLFELLNLRMADWYYVFVPASLPLRWAGVFAAFATVLPALYLAHRWMASLGVARGWSRPTFRVRRRHYAACVILGAAFLGLSLWRRDAFFPLIWGAATLLLEPFNHARDPATSLLGDLARGSWTRIVRILAGGAAIGLLWESFNALAGSRWIYTVPGLEHLKLFEMPLPGFLGFPVFALDGFVIFHALGHLGAAVPGWTTADVAEGAAGGERTAVPSPSRGSRLRPARVLPAVLVGLAFCAAVQLGVDRLTIDATKPRVSDLPGLPRPALERLRAAGLEDARDLADADPDALARRSDLPEPEVRTAVRAARLAALRGVGTVNAGALWAGGVRSVCDLASAAPAQVSSLVRAVRDDPRAGRPARVRVWLRAAREACPGGRSGPAATGGRPDRAESEDD
ncbi:MAG TPA: DUF4332 domain-containing protein [Gemmatimonadota bacterium]|nr:DUF4332 domain-containing protein [Gemmatimonadota bacterium]